MIWVIFFLASTALCTQHDFFLHKKCMGVSVKNSCSCLTISFYFKGGKGRGFSKFPPSRELKLKSCAARSKFYFLSDRISCCPPPPHIETALQPCTRSLSYLQVQDPPSAGPPQCWSLLSIFVKTNNLYILRASQTKQTFFSIVMLMDSHSIFALIALLR